MKKMLGLERGFSSSTNSLTLGKLNNLFGHQFLPSNVGSQTSVCIKITLTDANIVSENSQAPNDIS